MKKTNLLFMIFLSILFFNVNDAITKDKILKYQAKSFCKKEYKYGEWTDWSEWEKTNILITVDLETDILTLNNKKNGKKIKYYLTDLIEEDEDEDGNPTYTFKAMDEDDEECVIKFVYLDENGENLQIYLYLEAIIINFYVKQMN